MPLTAAGCSKKGAATQVDVQGVTGWVQFPIESRRTRCPSAHAEQMHIVGYGIGPTGMKVEHLSYRPPEQEQVNLEAANAAITVSKIVAERPLMVIEAALI